MTQAAQASASTRFRLNALVAALLLAFGGALAQTDASTQRADELRRDIYTLDSRIAVGIGGVSDDNRRFGQHRGLTGQGAYGLLDLDLVRRDDDTGTWFKLIGRNLGLDTREARLTHERQGDWAYSLGASRLLRREPLVVNTGLAGAGTPTQVVSATAPRRNLELAVDRDLFTLGVRKFFLGRFDVQVSFSQDESRGDRMFGRGTGNVMEFITEPIDRVTRQWQVVAGYADSRMQFSGGYGGSSYQNDMPVLRTSGGNSATTVFGPAWVIALPPSNEAHQVHLSGGFNLSGTARSSFKASYQVATQNEVFDPVFVRNAGTPDSLNGKVATSLVFADLVLRPLPPLDLMASLRWEDRDDRTPEARFLPDTPATVGGSFNTAGTSGLYKPRSFEQLRGVVEAGWTFGGGYRLLGVVEQENIERTISDKYRRMGMRRKNDETTVRLDFKRTGSDWLNGGVTLLRSERGGSEYVADTNDPNALTQQVGNITWADRTRDKLRLAGDWSPLEAASLQLVAEAARDTYSGRNLGPKKGDALFVAADGSWRINDKWSASAWMSQERTRMRQSTRSDRVGNVALGFNTLWDADLMVTTRAAGASVKGRVRGNLDLGLDLSGSNDVVKNVQSQVGGTGTLPVTSLPEMFYRTRTIKLFADLALDRMSGIRVDLAQDRKRSNDWTWVNWVYNGSPNVAAATRNSDGTTVTLVPRENVVYLGVVYHLRWR